MAQNYLQPIPAEVDKKLIKPYWPGALTIVLPCLTNKVPDLVRGGTDNLGVRMPNHRDILEIIKTVNAPILGPSANFHGEKTPYNFEDLDKDLIKQVDFVLKGECTTKLASTVINCSEKPWKIIRQGAINLSLPGGTTKQSTILLIDTTNNQTIKVGLEINGKKSHLEQPLDKHKAQALLPLIEKILKDNNLTFKDLTGINANPGPGSFTGIRVGLTVANTLATLLKIPINGNPIGKLTKPKYS